MAEDNGKKKKGTGTSSIQNVKQFFLKEIQELKPRRQKTEAFSGREARFYFLFSLGLAVLVTVLLMPTHWVSSQSFMEGEISHKNIYAPEDILVEDTISTELNRQKSFDAVKDIYDLDLEPLRAITSRVTRAFEIMKKGYLENEPDSYRFILDDMEVSELTDFGSASAETTEKRREFQDNLRNFEAGPVFARLEKKFDEALGIEISKTTRKVFRWHHYRPHIADWMNTILSELMQNGVVAQKEFLPDSSKKGIEMVVTGSGSVRGPIELDDIFDVKEAFSFARSRAAEMVAPQHPSLRRELVAVLQELVRPNLTFNKADTLKARNAARETVSSVYSQVKKGELIIGEGEKITPQHLLRLRKMQTEMESASPVQTISGILLFVVLIIAASWAYIRIFHVELAKDRLNMVLLGIMFAMQAMLLRAFYELSDVFANHWTTVELSSIMNATPYAVGPMLAAIFFPGELVILIVMASALICGLIPEASSGAVWLSLAGGMVAFFHTGRIKKHADVWMTGMHMIAVNVAVIIVANLLSSDMLTLKSLHDLFFGALGPIVMVGLTLTLMPPVEKYFPVVSDIKLLGLSDLNHPLLARMAVVSPGTYHHSVVVGNLAEDAAEAIGANPLLARVGAYFHDIGKMAKPEYFIENQGEGVNRHDNLSPSMSALVIISHVTMGLEMAKAYKIIPQIRDMIKEHHGTQLIQYFYKKAKDMEKPGIQPVREHDFRYPGVKPRTKESAIVMLADSVEAASRTLKNPTSSRLRQLVVKIIDKRFLEGQLDESHLTLHDLKKIGDSFVHILHGIFHYRVEYPEERTDDDSADNRKVWDQKAERYEDQGETRANLKRIV